MVFYSSGRDFELKFSLKCKAGSLGSYTCKSVLLPLSHGSKGGWQDFGGPRATGFVEAGSVWQRDSIS